LSNSSLAAGTSATRSCVTGHSVWCRDWRHTHDDPLCACVRVTGLLVLSARLLLTLHPPLRRQQTCSAHAHTPPHTHTCAAHAPLPCPRTARPGPGRRRPWWACSWQTCRQQTPGVLMVLCRGGAGMSFVGPCAPSTALTHAIAPLLPSVGGRCSGDTEQGGCTRAPLRLLPDCLSARKLPAAQCTQAAAARHPLLRCVQTASPADTRPAHLHTHSRHAPHSCWTHAGEGRAAVGRRSRQQQ
jgi:hypothetical protein